MERAHRLKALGHARRPLSNAWLEDGGRLGALSRTGFPRRPRMEPCDRLVRRLDAAPPVEAIGVPARSMSRQSHIRLTPEHDARAVDVLASIAR